MILPRAIASHPFSGCSMLVVEDEVLISMLLQDLLTEFGCDTVSVANSVSQALLQIDSRHYDGAMLDLHLGGTDSYGIADALVRRNIPFFFSTGEDARNMTKGYAGYPILRKPFTDDEIVEMFSRILPKAR